MFDKGELFNRKQMRVKRDGSESSESLTLFTVNAGC